MAKKKLFKKLHKRYKKFIKNLIRNKKKFIAKIIKKIINTFKVILKFITDFIFKAIIGICISILLIIVISITLHSFYKNFILPNTFIGPISVSSLTKNEAYKILSRKSEDFINRKLVIVFKDKEYYLSLKGFNIKYNILKNIEEAFAIGHSGNFWKDQEDLFESIIFRNKISPRFSFNEHLFKIILQRKIPALRKTPKNAKIISKNKTYEIISGKKGEKIDFEGIFMQTKKALAEFDSSKIVIKSELIDPEISTEEAKIAIKKAKEMISNDLVLVWASRFEGTYKWIFFIKKNPEVVKFYNEKQKIIPHINREELKKFLEEKVSPEIFRKHSDAMLVSAPTPPNKYAKIDGIARDGLTLLIRETVQRIEENILEGKYTVDLVVYEKKGKIISNTAEISFPDLISVGRSNFAGSTWERVFNIKKGLEKYNGLIINPKEKFSFNEYLGIVEEYNGWEKALAIFDGGDTTHPVAGGGLCQVSTTFYRAALYGGFPIIKRKPHSFYVSYYKAYGEGLDATIYPGISDFVFLNNTSSPILITAYSTDKNDAFIKIFGTSDGRKVTLDGPHKSAWHRAPPKYIETSLLPKDKKEIDKKEIPGITITWYQTIEKKNGDKETNELVSKYKAIPAKIKIGTETPFTTKKLKN